MSEKSKAEPASNVVNSLRALRMAKGLSQGQLADGALVTRQAVCAIESDQYLPTTAVALRLASVLGCHVEDIFSLKTTGELIEGEWVWPGMAASAVQPRTRVKVAKIEDRFVVRPVAALGEILNYIVPADGLIIGKAGSGTRAAKSDRRVLVRLLRERQIVEREIAVAGCDPAINLASEYLHRHKDASTVVGWSMGSAAALDALKRKEVHMAGLHILDAKTGESNLPYLRRHLQGDDYIVVTFAAWEEGLIVRNGNPKRIRGVDDLVRPNLVLVNREEGAGSQNAAGSTSPDIGHRRYRAEGVRVERQFALRRRAAYCRRPGRCRHRRTIRRSDFRPRFHSVAAGPLRSRPSEAIFIQSSRVVPPSRRHCQPTVQD